MVHGKIPAETKGSEYAALFAERFQIMVGTTVIEVINVPNASVMVIGKRGEIWIVSITPAQGRVGRARSRVTTPLPQRFPGLGRMP